MVKLQSDSCNCKPSAESKNWTKPVSNGAFRGSPTNPWKRNFRPRSFNQLDQIDENQELNSNETTAIGKNETRKEDLNEKHVLEQEEEAEEENQCYQNYFLE